jgi:hypothetical protein
MQTHSRVLALDLAHYPGQLADFTDLSSWLTQYWDDLLDPSERYWSGLFHCYHITGLLPNECVTNTANLSSAADTVGIINEILCYGSTSSTGLKLSRIANVLFLP